jgi:Acyltransferase family
VDQSVGQRHAATRVGGSRLPYLDRLKVILVAGVIFGHAWVGYADLGSWAYTDIREVTLAPATETILEIGLGPFGLFAIGLFLFIAGLLTPASIDRKGARRFARDRLVRLGLPILAFLVILWPPVRWLMDRVAGRTGSPFWPPDLVQLWYAVVLLLFSIAYAAWRRPIRLPERLTVVHLQVLAAVIALLSFGVRIRFPLDGDGPLGLHFAQWPQFVGLFALGVAGARRGWFDPVPARLARSCGLAAVIGIALIGVFALAAALAGARVSAFLGGAHWASLAVAAAEGLLAVNLSVWVLFLAQRHLNAPATGDRAVRGAYAAFVIQGHVLVGLALLLRPVPVLAEPKGLVVSA